MIQAADVTRELLRGGIPVSLDQVQKVLEGIDQAAILQAQKDSLTYEIWDKTSPINGVPAATFLNRTDVPAGGEIYLIRDKATGNVLYFQPHAPGVAGMVAMTPENVASYAQKHLEEIAQARADAQVLQQVMQALI